MRRIAILVVLSACAGAQRPVQPPAPADADGDARLGDAVIPLAYDLTLHVDPTQARFRGEEDVRVRIVHPTREIRLHGQGLHVTAVDAGGVTGAAREGRAGGLLLTFEHELPAGERTLHLAWDAPLEERLSGLYRARVGDLWYASTQMEALDARRAFPCFDEPRFKTPFTVAVHVPHGNVAAGNAPIASAERRGAEHVIRFEPTRPLPTYLVALAVGPFDVVDGGTVQGRPLRLLAPAGTGELGRFALSRVEPVLRELTGFFGQPLPYPKLDLVAVPAFGFGAMENPGLVIFRDSRLLLDAARASAQERKGFDALLAHELAHFWFGDLVTMAWWDDIWLNEGMATFMASRVVQALHPGTGAELDPVRSAAEVMLQDGLGSARAVRQPIRDGGDVLTAFDGITYVKGMAVLRMVEAWIGEDAFRAGVRAYVAAHADGNATTGDLLAALEEASGKPVARVATSFLDHPGVPLVSGTTTCGPAGARVRLAQERYRPLGSSADGGTWTIPVCLSWAARAGAGRACVLLDEGGAEVEIPGGRCPERLHLNAGATGYYRFQLPAADVLALAKAEAQLPDPEAVSLTGELDALLAAGRLDPADHLEALRHLLRSRRRSVVEGAVASLHRVYRAAVEGDPAREEAFARYVRAALGERGRRLGLEPRRGESTSDELLRPAVVGTLVNLGRDARLQEAATRLADRWLGDRAAVPRGAAQLALPLAAASGDAGFHGRLVEALARDPTPGDRALVLAGLGSFRDPAIVARSLALYLEPRTRNSDLWYLAGPPSGRRETRPVVLAWVDANYEAIAAKMGDAASGLPGIGGSACSDAAAEELRRIFSPAARRPPGTERRLAQAVESVTTCARLRDAAADRVAAYLDRVR